MKNQDNDSEMIELFKKVSVLKEIRSQYTQYMAARFPTSILFEKYQHVEKNGRFIPQAISAAEVIQRAYPVLKFDKKGKPIDNREQKYIDAVDNFTKEKLKTIGALTKDEHELMLAIEVYAALSSIETQKARLKIRLKELKKELQGEELQVAIKNELNTFTTYCNELLKPLKNHEKILARGKKSATLFGKMINVVEDLVKYLQSKLTVKPLIWGHAKVHPQGKPNPDEPKGKKPYP